MAGELHLRIVTPDRTTVDRKVAGVRFTGIDGKYGILPRHAPLLTALAPAGSVEVDELDGKQSLLFAGEGFAQVQQGLLTIVCEASEYAHEIDLERVKLAEARAREKLTHLDKLSEDFLKAESALRKAMMREMLVRRASGTGSMA